MGILIEKRAISVKISRLRGPDKEGGSEFAGTFAVLPTPLASGLNWLIAKQASSSKYPSI